MASFNKVIVAGNLTADPELKQTTSGTAVASVSVAVNRRPIKDKDGNVVRKTDFLNVVAWRGNAEFLCRYFKKGSNVIVCGQLQTRTWTDNNGQKRYATEIVADEITFGDNKPANNSASNDSDDAETVVTSAVHFEELSSDEELPF